MQAIEFETIAHQHVIRIPENIRVADGQHMRVLLLVDTAEAPAHTDSGGGEHGSEEIFRLLTELSDDFMAGGRRQPPLQDSRDAVRR